MWMEFGGVYFLLLNFVKTTLGFALCFQCFVFLFIKMMGSQFLFLFFVLGWKVSMDNNRRFCCLRQIISILEKILNISLYWECGLQMYYS